MVIPNLVERLAKAELSTAVLPWPDTPYRTVRRRDNRQAAEVAAEAAEEFFAPLVVAAEHLSSADPEAVEAAMEELAEACRQIGSRRTP